MKLVNLREDVVDFQAAKKKKFWDKAHKLHPEWKEEDADLDRFDSLSPKEQDRELANYEADRKQNKKVLLQKYGDEIKAIDTFLASPVLAGGFKTGDGLYLSLKKLQNARKRGRAYVEKIPEQEKRALQKVVSDEVLYKKVMHFNSLVKALEKEYGMLWATFGDEVGDNLELVSTIGDLLVAARKYYVNAA